MPRKILLVLAVVSCLTTFRSHLVQMEWKQNGWSAGAPHSAHPIAPNLESDLDMDGRVERILLDLGRVSILRSKQILWASPRDWHIVAAQTADLNWDDLPEVTLLVWRPFQPWPVDAWLPHGGRIEDFHDSENRSCHIILIGWDGNTYRELWAGSALARPILSFRAADWDGDGRQELLAVESMYADPAQGRALALWKWNGFGFSLFGRRPVGIGKLEFLQDENGLFSVVFDHPYFSGR